MTYEQHLRAAINALKAADPSVSDRSISLRAGLHAGWVGDFMASDAATMTRATRVLCAVAEMCPDGEAGADVRAVLSILHGAGDVPGPSQSGVAA